MKHYKNLDLYNYMGNLSPTKLAKKIGKSKSYISKILRKDLEPSYNLALQIYELTNNKYGDLVHLKDSQIKSIIKGRKEANQKDDQKI